MLTQKKHRQKKKKKRKFFSKTGIAIDGEKCNVPGWGLFMKIIKTAISSSIRRKLAA